MNPVALPSASKIWNGHGGERQQVRQLLLRHAEHAMHDLALGGVGHEHLLELRLVDARHHLVEDRDQLLRHVRAGEHLELLVLILRAEYLRGALYSLHLSRSKSK